MVPAARYRYHWTLVDNIKRDPFEQAVGRRPKIAPWAWRRTWLHQSTAYMYDWNMLPIGQQLWAEGVETYRDVPASASPGELQPERHPEQEMKAATQASD